MVQRAFLAVVEHATNIFNKILDVCPDTLYEPKHDGNQCWMYNKGWLNA